MKNIELLMHLLEINLNIGRSYSRRSRKLRRFIRGESQSLYNSVNSLSYFVNTTSPRFSFLFRASVVKKTTQHKNADQKSLLYMR